jgi:transposase
MLYAGLDYHLRTSDLCILNEDGKAIKRTRVRGGRDEVAAELAALGEPVQVVFEATGGYGPLHERLSGVAGVRRVVMAHPAHLRLIWGTKRKNDRLDAHKLAKLLYLDAVPAAHVPPPAVRRWRRLVELRRALVRRRAAVKNQVHALLRGAGVSPPARMALFARAGLDWLAGVALDDAAALERSVLLEQMRQAKDQVRQVERALRTTSASDPRVALLRTVPGVGPRTAETFCAYVDRINRFGRVGEVGSYFGMVPCQDSSAGRERLGHLTRQGPPLMRQLLVEAAWSAVRTSAALRGRFERVCRGDPGRRKLAIVAVAHHLCEVMAAVLRDGRPWREPAVS